jgi:hypothetical protein
MLLSTPTLGIGRRWAPFGDHTVIGWSVTVGYFVAAFLCWRAYRADGGRRPSGSEWVSPRFWYRTPLWWWLFWLILALGFNKQLDLQILLTNSIRRAALISGWWVHRRKLQAVYVGGAVLVGIAIAIFIASKLRSLRPPQALAALGVAFLTIFAVARLASFHYLDLILFTNVGFGTTLAPVLEIIGIALVASGAYLGQRPR